MKLLRVLTLAGVFSSLVAWSGCAPSPKPVTPASQFAEAKEMLRQRTHDRALDSLAKLSKQENEMAERARMLSIAVLGGMGESYREMADAYMKGSTVVRTEAEKMRFRKMAMDYYGMARVRSLNYVEQLLPLLRKSDTKPFTVEARFPEASAVENATLNKLQQGIWVGEEERYRAELDMLDLWVAKILCASASVSDLNQGRALYQKGTVDLDPRGYFVAMAKTMMDASALFTPKALDNSRMRRLFYEKADETLDVSMRLLKMQPDKALETRARRMKQDCQKELKRLPA